MDNEIRIPVTIGGVTFKNPFYVASGPTTKTVKQLLAIERTGWAAASIKLSIDPAPYINRKPRYSLFKDRDALAFTTEKRLTCQEGLDLISEAKPLLHDLILMANITYAGDDGVPGWVNMAKRFEAAGADIIELNMCCPNMSYNLEMTSGGTQSAGKQTGASMGQQADVAAEIVRAVKQAISIPLFVKLTPEGGQIAQVAKALYAAGADAVGGTGNRLGMPPIDLDDPAKAFFHLQKEISMGCYCSGWLKPLAQRDTYEIRKVCGMEAPIMAAGGITDWRSATEMLLCGADLLGVCAETLISGYDIVKPMLAGLDAYMKQHGYTDLSQFKGQIVSQVKTATDVTLYGGYAHIVDPKLSAPCKAACPLHIPTQGFIQKLAKGDLRGAYDLITGSAPLQELCAVTCQHPCEDACVRGGVDAPVRIRELKRFVLNYGKQQSWTPAWASEEANGGQVAVVGAGATGLACAAFLRSAGYAVTVFEKEATAGGSLRSLIPGFRLDKALLQEQVEALEAQGVSFRYNQELTAPPDGYCFTVFATGESTPAGDGYTALQQLAAGEELAFTGTIAVAGKGQPAIDLARSIARLGADKVIALLSDAPKRSWLNKQLALAAEEGITCIPGARQVAFDGTALRFVQNGVALSMTCDRAFLFQPATSGEGIAGQQVYRAEPRENIASAIAEAKKVCARADADFRGDRATVEPVSPVRTVKAEAVRQRTGYLRPDKGVAEKYRPAAQRSADFAAEAVLYTMEEARKEAARCLNCGCGEGCQLCKTICTDFAPQIVGPDTLQICKEDCVACGMCYNRCPNGNIEMINLGHTV